MPHKIAESEEHDISFWDIEGEVYRVNKAKPDRDTRDQPMGARWECSLGHWKTYREVYGWATDA